MALTRMQKKPAGGSQPVSKVASKGPRLNVLYVEDDDTNWELARVALSKEYEVFRAANSRQAFQEIGKREYLAILMDIQLAGSDLDGIGITKNLKRTSDAPQVDYAKGVDIGETPILFVTAYGGSYSREDLVQAGGDDMITKPVDFTRLRLAITRLTARKTIGRMTADKKNPDAAKRTQPRQKMEFACQLELGRTLLNGKTLDISAGGAKISVSDPRASSLLPIGAEVKVALPPIFEGVKIDAKVLRLENKAPYTIGIMFKNWSAEQRMVLHRWLYGT